MYSISAIYEHLLKKRTREWDAKVVINDKEYGRNFIIDFEIDSSIVSAEDFEIGTVIVPKLTIRLKTHEKLPENAKIIPYVATSLDLMTWQEIEDTWEEYEFPWAGGVTEWLPLGEYYIDQRVQINSTWEYTCYGKLMLANAAYISSLSYPASMQAVWNEICTFLDFEYDNSVVIDSSYSIPVAPTGYTMRQVMGFIAGANSASVFEGKDGTIKFKVYQASDDPVYELTVSDYIRLKQTNPIKSYTRIVGIYDTDDSLTYEAGEGDENHTLTLENPFLTQDIIDDLLTKIDGFTFMPTSIDARAYPQLEIGDMLGVYRDDSLPWVDTEIEWEDNELPWDGLVKYPTIIMKVQFRFKGGLFMAIESNAHSEQQSEFKVDGSISAQIKRINQSAVKLEKTYYGVSVSKEYGFRVDRSDGLAYSIWNADEFRFVANGEDALWFDIPSRRFKFSGIIEASTIYGTNFRTNAGSYPYVELSSDNNVFRAAKSVSSYIEIDANPDSYAAPIIKHVDGDMIAFTGAMAGSYFSLVSKGSYDIGAQDGAVRINGGNIQLTATQTVVNSHVFIPIGKDVVLGNTSHLLFGGTSLSTILNGVYSRLSALESQ